MTVRTTRQLSVALLLGISLVPGGLLAAEQPRPAPQQVEFFEKEIRPLLAEKCWNCHGEKKQEGGLRLDSRAAILKGGDGGAAALAGRPDDSELIQAIGYDGPLKMPPKGKLSDKSIAAMTEWVRLGLPWSDERSTGPAAGPHGFKESHWSFQPIK